MKKIIFHIVCSLVVLVGSPTYAQKSAASIKYQQQQQEKWVDSVYNSLSLDHQLGQLFMVAAYSNRDESHAQFILNLVKNYNIGGLIFFQGGPYRQAILTNRYQAAAKVPLLLSMDAEWGLGMRLDSTMNFPKQMTLGAIQNDRLIYKMGKEIARQCRRVGMHVNFAPVVDVNVNPNNPVIGYRSFGENKYLVAQKGVAYMKGLQDGMVMANAKHFPGHGDTDRDSHYSLPVIKHSKARIDSIELYPFKELIKEGLMSMMVAHLNIPSLDNAKHRPTTLSQKVVTDLLRKELGFQGIAFTDAMNMHGITKYYKAGKANSEALHAGNDVLLFPSQVPEAIERLKLDIKRHKISQEDIETRVKKILRVKYWAGLHENTSVNLNGLHADLHTKKADLLNKKLYQEAITTVRNEGDFLPIRRIDTNSFAVVSIGRSTNNTFQKTLKKYAPFDLYSLSKNQSDYSSLLKKLKRYKVVVVGVQQMSNRPSRKFGVTANSLAFLNELKQYTKVITTVFGNAYSLKYFSNEEHLICAYEENEYTLSLVPQIIFGAINSKGKLPITPHESIPYGTGIQLKSLGRLGYGKPEEVGINSEKLHAIDTIIQWAIQDRMTPGCQILFAKDGKVIYEKAFGSMTYQKKTPVTTETIYDLASITKVAGTLQSIMHLHEKGEIDLNRYLSSYLREAKKTNKSKVVIRDMLTHQAGLQPYIPFWYENTIVSDSIKDVFYQTTASNEHPIRVADQMYVRSDIEDSLIHWTLDSEMYGRVNRKSKKYPYKYSDLGYHLLKRVAEQKLDRQIETYLKYYVYKPLGMSNTSYNPTRNGFTRSRIAPTEIDSMYRKATVHGTVHDQVAAMVGGVGGHAGLFSNANDLAKLFQMLLNKGKYGGVRFYKGETVNLFTGKQNKYCRRGIGFDKPEWSGLGPSSEMVSSDSFGHSGFTGTLAWADPNYDLVYIFLSNRTYPNSANNLLLKHDIRTRVQDVMYEAMMLEKK